MDFTWDEAKNEWLKRERLISFEEIAAMIQRYEYVEVIDNPSRPGQHCVLLNIRSYTWVVPYVIDAKDRMVLKTAFPSRKQNRLHREQE